MGVPEDVRTARPLRRVIWDSSLHDDPFRKSATTATAAAPTAATAAALTEPPHRLDEERIAWLSAYGLQPPADAAEGRARLLKGEEVDVSQEAIRVAWQICDLASASQLPRDESEIFDESLLSTAAAANAARRRVAAASRAELTASGLTDEHSAMELEHLLPLLHEMAFTRAVGASTAARHRMPTAASYGPAHRWPVSDTLSAPPPADATLMMVVVSRSVENVSWLATLPPRVDYHIMQHVAYQPELPRAKQTLMPRAQAIAAALAAVAAARGGGAHFSGGSISPKRRARGGAAAEAKSLAAAAASWHGALGTRRASSHALLAYLSRAAENEELIELLSNPEEAKKRVLISSTDRDTVDNSIQSVIVEQLRRKSERVMDLLKRWDKDKSGSIEKNEFRRALRTLKVSGSYDEYDMLFDSWDVDGSGSIQYTELLAAMHAGRRFDVLQRRKAAPPLPPALVCTHAEPLRDNPTFFEDLALLVRAAAAGRTLPAFVPLGKGRTGERLLHCDASGTPADAHLLPIGSVWRGVFGSSSQAPLWLTHTPGGLFAVSRDAVIRRRGEASAREFYEHVIKSSGVAPPPPPPEPSPATSSATSPASSRAGKSPTMSRASSSSRSPDALRAAPTSRSPPTFRSSAASWSRSLRSRADERDESQASGQRGVSKGEHAAPTHLPPDDPVAGHALERLFRYLFVDDSSRMG